MMPFLFLQSVGPQCNLYVPAPILKPGENVVVQMTIIYFNIIFMKFDFKEFLGSKRGCFFLMATSELVLSNFSSNNSMLTMLAFA